MPDTKEKLELTEFTFSDQSEMEEREFLLYS